VRDVFMSQAHAILVSVMYRSTNTTVFSASLGRPQQRPHGFCPKYRRRVLTGDVEARLKAIIAEVVAEHDAEVIEVEVMPDHVHLLVEIPPQVPLSGFMKILKGRSSRILRQEFPRLKRLPSLWTRSWFVSTVGGAPLEVVRQYVEGQKEAA
jgi:putative transposase